MKLVKQLPIGLGLACMVMLSSCSKEDTQTPTPKGGEVNESSGLREGGPGWMNALPKIPGTTGPTGKGVYAPGWIKAYWQSSATMGVLPSGTSNSKYLWGDPNLPWIKPMPSIVEIPNTASFITIAAHAYGSTAAITKAVITHLKPGKRYSITFYGASAIANRAETYPLALIVSMSKCISDLWATEGCGLDGGAGISFSEDKGTWISKTIEFEATGTEATLNFTGVGWSGYFNIFVDENSIKQLN